MEHPDQVLPGESRASGDQRRADRLTGAIAGGVLLDCGTRRHAEQSKAWSYLRCARYCRANPSMKRGLV